MVTPVIKWKGVDPGGDWGVWGALEEIGGDWGL